MQGTGKIACVGGSVVHQLGDFFDIIYFDDAMVFQSQCDRARHECDRGEVLAKPIVQFLAKSLLFAITDFKNLAFKAFTLGPSVKALKAKFLKSVIANSNDLARNCTMGFASTSPRSHSWRARSHCD